MSTGKWEGISLLLADCCRFSETSFSTGNAVVVVVDVFVVLVVVLVDVLAVLLLLLLLLLDPKVVVVRSVDLVPAPMGRTSLKVRLLERTLSTIDGCSWSSPKPSPSATRACACAGGPLLPANAAVEVLTKLAIDIWF